MRDLIKRILREELFENRPKVSDEEIRRRISKFETLNDLIKYDQSAYLLAKNRGEDFFDDVTKDLVRLRKKSVKPEKDLLKIINRFSDTQSLEKSHPDLVSFLKRKGEDYYDKMTKGSKRVNSKLSADDILKIASQYNTFREFTLGNPIAVNALRYRYYRYGDKELMDKVENMLSKRKVRDKYTDD